MIGPGKLPLEVQIRTYEMHAHAELGVAAHLQYKEGRKAESSFQQKIVWLRQLLEPAQRDGAEPDLLANLQAKEIDPDDAYVYANDKRAFSRFVTDTSVLPKLDLAPS